MPGHARQASLGRLVTITRYWAGILSSRSELSSPITIIVARQQGHALSSGSSVTSIRGRSVGKAAFLLRRVAIRSSRNFGSRFSASASFCAIACSIASRPSCSCSSGRRSDFVPNCMRPSFSSRCCSRSFRSSSMSRSAVIVSRSVVSAITIARSTSISSGRLELAAGSVPIAHEFRRRLRVCESFLFPEPATNQGRRIEPRTQQVKASSRRPLLVASGSNPAASASRSAPGRSCPHQNFHPIGALRAINNDRSRERILGQDFLRQCSKSVCALPEVDRSRRQQHPCAGGNADHDREADARTARNTAVSWAPSSCPPTTRTTAPASFTSITGTHRDANRRGLIRLDRNRKGKKRPTRTGRARLTQMPRSPS